MKKIPSFQDFERNIDLNQKVSPQLAESLSLWFSEDPSLNEAKGLDTIKNFLSKTFLGSLSYINIIDKVRSEVLKLEKEMVSKEYSYQDEIESIRKSMKEFSSSGEEDSYAKLKRSLDLKNKEYESYKKMTETRINKALETLKDAIKGNRRRNEYYQTGKTQDEVELAEFEYELAKKRASSSPDQTSSDDLKKMENEIKRLREEAERAKQELEAKQIEETKSKKEAEEEGVKTLSEKTPDFLTSLKSVKGTRALIVYLEKEAVNLKDSLNDAKKDSHRKMIENQIGKIKNDLKVAKEVLKNHLDKKLASTQKKHAEKEALQRKAAEDLAQHDAERKGASQKIGIEKSDSPGEKSKTGRKTREVSQHEREAKTSNVVNKFSKQTKKVLD